MKAVIATYKKPLSQENFRTLVEIIRDSMAEGQLTLQGLVVLPGPGCWNYGLMFNGDKNEAENFLNQVTMQLLGKWNFVSDDDPAVIEGQFEFIEE